MKLTRRIAYDFYGAYAPPVVASRQGAWCSKITKTAGTPTVQSANLGTLDLALDTANEVQNLCLYMGDVLPFDVGYIVRAEFLAKVSNAALNAAITGFIGLGNTRNDAIASITKRVGFVLAANALNVDAVDGTNTATGKSTGFSLGTTFRRFAIDFSVGGLTQQPPSKSKGGIADVRVFVSNDKGALQQVVPATRLDLSALVAGTDGLQFIFQLQKTANAAAGTLSIKDPAIEVLSN